MAKKMLLVFNLKAGTSSIRGKVADILNILTRGGYDVTAHPSQGPNDMEHFVRKTDMNLTLSSSAAETAV